MTCMDKVLSSIFEKQITFTILPRLKEMESRIQFASQRFLKRKQVSSTSQIINNKVNLVTLSFRARPNKNVLLTPISALTCTKRCSVAVAFLSRSMPTADWQLVPKCPFREYEAFLCQLPMHNLSSFIVKAFKLSGVQ